MLACLIIIFQSLEHWSCLHSVDCVNNNKIKKKQMLMLRKLFHRIIKFVIQSRGGMMEKYNRSYHLFGHMLNMSNETSLVNIVNKTK